MWNLLYNNKSANGQLRQERENAYPKVTTTRKTGAPDNVIISRAQPRDLPSGEVVTRGERLTRGDPEGDARLSDSANARQV